MLAPLHSGEHEKYLFLPLYGNMENPLMTARAPCNRLMYTSSEIYLCSTAEFLNILWQHWKTMEVLYLHVVPDQHCTSVLFMCIAMWQAWLRVHNCYYISKPELSLVAKAMCVLLSST